MTCSPRIVLPVLILIVPAGCRPAGPSSSGVAGVTDAQTAGLFEGWKKAGARLEAAEAVRATTPAVTAPGQSASAGDVRVRVTGWHNGPVRLRDGDSAGGLSKESCFAVDVELLMTSPARKAEYRTWQAPASLSIPLAKLVDNLGNDYRLAPRDAFGAVGMMKAPALDPDKPVTDKLLFEPVLPAARELTLTLPAEHVGAGEGFLKFRLPLR